VKIATVATSVFTIPTDLPESDGTISWDSTTLVLVELTSDTGEHGIGFSYASAAAATVVRETLAPVLRGQPVDDVGLLWNALVAAVRNIGRQGVAATAISAADVALWDLKARAAGLPLFKLLGPCRDGVPVYGSGGFTSYSDEQLTKQLGGWVHDDHIPRVKMKIGQDWGTNPARDIERVRVARAAIGPDAQLFVDANGAYTSKQAIGLAQRFAESGVTYFEEPVSSDQLHELAFVRQHTPMDIAAGEYGWDPWYFREMLRAEAVDVMQADVTRCLGISGWLMAAQLAYAHATPFSAHCSPAIHAQVGCAAPQLAHVEYFHDHVRIERLLFDGFPRLANGCLYPDPQRPGLGLTIKRAEAERWSAG
jgi:L-alanine-DL-glutamate epimerase-like enolase superfamily enzyme